MRLDEWQKYIDSQFLEEEPKPREETAVPLPTAPTVAARPETTPNAIQNIVTMVVAAPPELPSTPEPPRAPRIELLTPLPDQKPVVESPPEVSNRTRRRSQLGGNSPEREAATEIASVPLSTAPDASSNAVPQGLFPPIENFDTDIPSFEQYLAGSRTLSKPDVPVVPAPNIELPTPPPNTLLDATVTAMAETAAAANNTSASVLPVMESKSDSPPLNTEIFVPMNADADAEGEDEPTIAAPTSTESDMTDSASSDTEDTDTELTIETERLRRAPKSRARYARNVRPENAPSGLSAADLWATVPRHVQTLLSLERLEEEKEIAQFSYKRPFQEKRHELIARLLDPILSLEDTARLLNVCPTTVRRYTNKGILTYYRKEPERSTKAGGTEGNAGDKETRQRRFRLSDILTFLETQQAAIANDRQTDRPEPAHTNQALLTDGKDV